MSIYISFTYQKVTEESAEHGDFSEHGFIAPGHWEYPMDETGQCGYEKTPWEIGDLSGLISFAQELGIISDGNSFYSVDEDIDYTTGEHTTYAMHIEGCTPSTECRIHALLEH